MAAHSATTGAQGAIATTLVSSALAHLPVGWFNGACRVGRKRGRRLAASGAWRALALERLPLAARPTPSQVRAPARQLAQVHHKLTDEPPRPLVGQIAGRVEGGCGVREPAHSAN